MCCWYVWLARGEFNFHCHARCVRAFSLHKNTYVVLYYEFGDRYASSATVDTIMEQQQPQLDEESGLFEIPSDEPVHIHIPSNAFDVKECAFDDDPPNIAFDSTYLSSQHANSKWNFNEMYIRSNSPIASNCNSDVEPEADSFALEHIRPPIRSTRKYKKFTYEDIEKSLSKYHNYNDKSFNPVDLLVTYLKGYIIIFSQSKNVTQMKLYSFLTVILSITSCLSIISPFVKNTEWGAYFISAGNALATILIVLMRYLKLEIHSTQYSSMMSQYSKLESMLEFESGSNPNMVTSECLSEVERKLSEMKEVVCHYSLVPDEISRLFPLLSNTNIFRFIHKMDQYKKNLIIRFRDIKNEIHYIMHRWNVNDGNIDSDAVSEKTPQKIREHMRLLYLMDLKEKTKNELLNCDDIYNQIDELFNREIRYAETHQSCFGCGGLFKPDYDFSKLNPVVRDYLKLVIPD